MGLLHVVVCYTVLAITVTSCSAAKSQCSPTSFKFSLISSRNRTGHWTSQVQLEQFDDKKSLPWNVAVEHNSVQCDGTENVGLIATLSGDCENGVFDISVSSFCTDTAQPGHDYELVSGLGFYKMYTEAATWDEARNRCIRDGTHLLILNSGAEMDAVKAIWSKNPKITGSAYPEYVHIGAHDRFTEGDYITIFDQKLSETGYTLWDFNEPNDSGGNEDCLSVKITGGLNDFACSFKLGYICEREL